MPAPTTPLALSSGQQTLLNEFDGFLDDAMGAGLQVGASVIENGLQMYSNDSRLAAPSKTADQARTGIRQSFRFAFAALLACGFSPGGGGGGGSATIKEVELDFGATPTYVKSFTITDPDILLGSKVIMTQSDQPGTGQTTDAPDMDCIVCRCKPAGVGSLYIFASTREGPVTGKFKFNYIIG